VSNPKTVIVDVTFDVVNDKTEDMMTAARRLLAAEAEIAVAKQELDKALTTRKEFVEGVLWQLQHGRDVI